MLANKKDGIIYIGVTNDLKRRIHEHKSGLMDGFTKKYNIKNLVWFEEFHEINDALQREKQLKNWHRDWKVNLIKEANPNWLDLTITYPE